MIRLLLAAGISLSVSIVVTKFLIHWLVSHRIGQPIHEDVPDGHVTKAGTPTMGGTAIVCGALVGYVLSNLVDNTLIGDSEGSVYTRTGIYVMLAIAGAGLVGLLDDWIKVANERNLGLNKRSKMLGLLAVAIALAVGLISRTGLRPVVSFIRADAGGISLAKWVWVIFAVLVITGFANAVNFTDGLDGLAAGAATLAFSAFVVIGFWAFRYPQVYEVSHALDLAVVSAAMMGGCLGFLWWNAPPAQIFMGDTGSLAIGTALAALALTTNTTLLLVIIGALFVVETVSVVLQVFSFRVFHRRIFRMAPIHHHFELKGWPETTVIIRFWIASGLCTALGLGLFYADFLSTGASKAEARDNGAAISETESGSDSVTTVATTDPEG
jgi:phospho-N-acetylmuramoyl-pentapeptide-transferase